MCFLQRTFRWDITIPEFWSVNEGIGIEPEDVKVADTATFIWQIQ